MRRADNLTTILYRCHVIWGNLISWNPLGHSRPVTGLHYLYQYYNVMGPPSYMRSVIDRNVVMRCIPVNQDTDTDDFNLVCDVMWPLIVAVGNMVSADDR